MSDVILSWELPVVTARQHPIDYARVEFRVDPSFPWVIQDVVVSSDVQELRFVDVAPGSWFYQVTVVDVVGAEGTPVEVGADVPFDVPGAVINLVAVIE